jgi:hypothetical protein
MELRRRLRAVSDGHLCAVSSRQIRQLVAESGCPGIGVPLWEYAAEGLSLTGSGITTSGTPNFVSGSSSVGVEKL